MYIKEATNIFLKPDQLTLHINIECLSHKLKITSEEIPWQYTSENIGKSYCKFEKSSKTNLRIRTKSEVFHRIWKRKNIFTQKEHNERHSLSCHLRLFIDSFSTAVIHYNAVKLQPIKTQIFRCRRFIFLFQN